MQFEIPGVDQDSGAPGQRTEVAAQDTHNAELERAQDVPCCRTRLKATASLFKPSGLTPVDTASVPMASHSANLPTGREAGAIPGIATVTKDEKAKAGQYYTTVMLRNLPNDYTRDML